MTTRDELYLEIELLFAGYGGSHATKRMLLYALVDIGHITSLSCAWDLCVLPDVSFAPGRDRLPESVSFDHIVAFANGGTDHWSNIQLMHNTCNMRKGAVFTDARRAHVSKQVRERNEDPTHQEIFRNAMRTWRQDPEKDTRQRESVRALSGDKHWTRRGRVDRIAAGDWTALTYAQAAQWLRERGRTVSRSSFSCIADMHDAIGEMIKNGEVLSC